MQKQNLFLLNAAAIIAINTAEPSFAQTTPGQLRSPCINTAVAGELPDTLSGGENLFSSGEYDDPIRAVDLSEPVIVRLIMEGLGIFRDIALIEFSFENACAAIDTSTNQRVIYFDRNWLTDYSDDEFWIKVGIFAHEIGHHVNNHTYESDSVARIRREHEADVFAGAAVAALGGSLDDALAFANKQPTRWSNTHPGRSTRRSSITEGYQRFEQVRSRIAIFSTQNSATMPADTTEAIQSNLASRDSNFSLSLVKALLNTMRSLDDPVIYIDPVHDYIFPVDGTTTTVSMPAEFASQNDTDRDPFLSDAFGGVNDNFIGVAVDSYVEGYQQFIWGNGLNVSSIRKPNVTIVGSWDAVGLSNLDQHCAQPQSFVTFLENYFIFANIYESFFLRAFGNDSYVADTGDDNFEFRTNGYFGKLIFPSPISLDAAIKAGFSPIMERELLRAVARMDWSWRLETKEFLETFLMYKELNEVLIQSAILDEQDDSLVWKFENESFISPFGCSAGVPRVFSQIEAVGAEGGTVTSYLGQELREMDGNMESRVLGFWLRRNAAGTVDEIAKMLARVIEQI